MNRFILKIIVALLLLVCLIYLGYEYLPYAVDWHLVYRPATLELISGRSPFLIPYFFNPPWILIPLIPFAILPERLGQSCLFFISIVSFFYAARRLSAFENGKANNLVALGFVLSPPVFHCLLDMNIDWLIYLGIFIPVVDICFFLSKPQIGFILSMWTVFRRIKAEGLKKSWLSIAVPMSLLFLSIVLYGPWFVRLGSPLLLQSDVNASFWPAGIPIGLYFAILAFWEGNLQYAMIASPFLSPYLLFQSWSVVLLSFSFKKQRYFWIVWAGFWILTILKLFNLV